VTEVFSLLFDPFLAFYSLLTLIIINTDRIENAENGSTLRLRPLPLS